MLIYVQMNTHTYIHTQANVDERAHTHRHTYTCHSVIYV